MFFKIFLEFSKLDCGRKGCGQYNKITGPWGHRYDVSIPNIDLVAGPHRQKKSTLKNFLSRFWGSKIRFFWFFVKCRHIAWDGQYRVSGCFPGPKGPISGQISYFRPPYKKISTFQKSHFLQFFTIFSILADLISVRDRPEMAGTHQNIQKFVLETL